MLADYQAAIDNYRKALKFDASNSQIHFNIGSALSATHQFIEAEIHYNRSIELKAKNTTAFLCLAEIYIQQ